MGAITGVDYCYEPDVDKAFRHLQDEALYDHGHAGYTGSIAEAGGYRVYEHTIRLLEDAEKRAWELANNVAVKWEEALAIPFVSRKRRIQITVPEYDHPKDYTKVQETLIEVALAEVRRKRLLRRGEKVTEVGVQAYTQEPFRASLGGYHRPSAFEKRRDVQMLVYIDRARSALTPEKLAGMKPDGWIFGGCYSC